jgi:hypothetical protein
MMRARAVLQLRFPSEESARAVARAVAVDNPPHLVQSRRGAVLHAKATGPSPRSLRETLDDYLRCAVAAEQAAQRGRPRALERL